LNIVYLNVPLGRYRHDIKVKEAAAEENRLHAELEKLRTVGLEAQLRIRQLENDLASCARVAEDRDRLAQEVSKLSEERRGHFFQVHELEAKLRKAATDQDVLRQTVRITSEEYFCFFLPLVVIPPSI
jgi:predicted nuclease with TOPRIM domain